MTTPSAGRSYDTLRVTGREDGQRVALEFVPARRTIMLVDDEEKLVETMPIRNHFVVLQREIVTCGAHHIHINPDQRTEVTDFLNAVDDVQAKVKCRRQRWLRGVGAVIAVWVGALLGLVGVASMRPVECSYLGENCAVSPTVSRILMWTIVIVSLLLSVRILTRAIDWKVTVAIACIITLVPVRGFGWGDYRSYAALGALLVLSGLAYLQRPSRPRRE